jgi:GGDEF domain-containing protein
MANMVSIRQSLTELERRYVERDTALELYRTAIENVAHYAIDLEEQATAHFRQYLEALAQSINPDEPQALQESGASLRALLRDYRNKAAEYLNHLRDELSSTAAALQKMVEALGQTDDDTGSRVRGALAGIREIARLPAAATVRESLLGAAAAIERSMEDLHHQHQATVAQFVVEIQILHKRIQSLEAAAAIDDLTRLYSRTEMERRICAIPAGAACLILMAVNGLRQAENRFSREVRTELAGAFAKRLRNCVPPESAIGRWGADEFVALLSTPEEEGRAAARFIEEHLSGTYVCLESGRTILPTLQVKTTVMPVSNGGSPQLVESVRRHFEL